MTATLCASPASIDTWKFNASMLLSLPLSQLC